MKRTSLQLAMIFTVIIALSPGLARAQAARNIQNGINATSYSSSSGAEKYGDDLTGVSHGDSVTFANLDFGSGISAIDMVVSVPTSGAGQPIEARLGSPTGQLIGQLAVTSTGSLDVYKTQRLQILRQSGVKTLVLRFPGSSVFGRMDSFKGIASSQTPSPTPGPSPGVPTPTPRPPTPTPVPQPPTPTPSQGASCTLQNSGQVVVNKNGQVIENLYIKTAGKAAIVIDGYSDVVIRNVRIEHSGAPGISFDSAHRLRIENVSVLFTAAPAKGALPEGWDDYVNIEGDGSNDVVIKNVRVEKGASGIRFLNSLRPRISFAEGHDFRGPFPRGQFVQLDKSHDGIIEDFSAENPSATAWTEDNINIYNSSNAIIRRGLLDGNNSPSGIGVIFEHVDGSAQGGLVEDVDAVRQGNGCFSAYPGKNVTFNRTRCSDNICTSQQNRGTPLSKALAWAAEPSSTNISLKDSSYMRLCNPGNVVWLRETFNIVEIAERVYTPRSALRLRFCWQ